MAKTRQQRQAEADARKAHIAGVVEGIDRPQVTPAPVYATAKGRMPVTGRIIFVESPSYPEIVDEDGNTHPALKVGFRVDNQSRYLRAIQPATHNIQEQIEQHARATALIAPRFQGWDFLHPETGVEVGVPNPEVWQTYLPLFLPQYGLSELGIWIAGEGIAMASAVALGLDPGYSGVDFEFARAQQEMRGLYATDGAGYQQALEESLPPNSEGGSQTITQSEPQPSSV